MTESRFNNLAFLAGYFMGEGSITFGTDKRYQEVPRLVVKVCTGDLEVIEMFVKTFGGNLNRLKKPPTNARRAQFYWQASGKRAQEVLKTLLPFLVGAKKEIADRVLGLTFAEKGGVKLTPEELDLRRSVRDFTFALNNRITLVG